MSWSSMQMLSYSSMFVGATRFEALNRLASGFLYNNAINITVDVRFAFWC